tara:strand:- start:20092 stop:21222 length:1131 start_codon:yes stop_codon:yes gene_type:complete
LKILDSTLFYTQSSGGVRTYIDAKRQALLRRDGMGHKVVLPGAGVRFEEDFIQLPAMPLPLAPGYRFPVRLGLWANVMAGLQPDVIEAGDPYSPAWAAQRAARMLDVPAVGFYHSDLLSLIHHRVGAFLDSGTRAYIRRLYQGFDLVLSPSQVMARRLAECGVEDVQVQALGVDLNAFHPRRAKPDARRTLGIEDDRPLLVFAGRGTQEKNIPVLLEAMRALPDYHLLLIGTGLQPEAPDNVSVIHEFCPTPEVAGWMAAADALVHAGDQETFGLVALEGMASGLPVVCADAGALPEVVPARCGRHAPANNGGAFAEAIRDLFEHDDPAALGRAARAHVEARHSWDTVVDSLLGHYHRVLGVYDQPVLARTHESHP